MIFPKDFPDKLRSIILPSEVVGKKVKLKLRGKDHTGLCPFHNEKTPSFSVNDQKGFYHCFGCQAHGDIISFVMNTEGLQFKEAVIKLAEDFGVEIPQVKSDFIQDSRIDRDYLILEKICNFFEQNLFTTQGKQALSYVKKRDIGESMIKKFRLGFALNSYESLINFLRSQSFTDEEISRTGVVGKSDQNKLYDKFRGRVIFPITNKKNQIIAFGGRTIADDLPKYLNSSETAIFKKNQTLYNFYNARKAIFSKGYAVVVEGYMDAISLASRGVENVVAGLGTALNPEHLKELFYITDKIIICLDGDSAGVKAAKRVCEFALPLITAKKNVLFAFLPNQMDPDDFIKQFGKDEFEALLLNASPLSEAMFDFAIADLGIDLKKKVSAENKAKLEALLAAKTEAIKDVSSKKYFSLFFRDKLFFIDRKQNKNSVSQVKSSSSAINALPKIYQKKHNISDAIEKNIIALLIKFPQFSQFSGDDVSIENLDFVNEELMNFKELIIDFASNNKNLSSEELLQTLEKSGFDEYLSEIKKIISGIENEESAFGKFRILILRDLLFQVEQQYKEALLKIDDISTHETGLTDEKVKEIFSYKNSLERKILALEKEII